MAGRLLGAVAKGDLDRDEGGREEAIRREGQGDYEAELMSIDILTAGTEKRFFYSCS